MTQIPGLPTISDTLLPASVRNGSQDDKDSYKTAMGFEQMLVGQLVQTMAGSGGATGTGDDDSGDTALDTSDPMTSGPFSGQMQDALSSAVMSAGGLGLAAQIYKGMQSS
jgi:hypothetical protein